MSGKRVVDLLGIPGKYLFLAFLLENYINSDVLTVIIPDESLYHNRSSTNQFNSGRDRKSILRRWLAKRLGAAPGTEK
jgi:hypothetical protein